MAVLAEEDEESTLAEAARREADEAVQAALVEEQLPSDETEPAAANAEEETPEVVEADAPQTDESEPAPSPDDERLGIAKSYMAQGREIAALSVYRKLGATYPENSEVLAGWSKAAAKTKGWGEALRVAIRWASTDQSSEAQLHLAKTQKRVGQKYAAIATLGRLLEREPGNVEAQKLLQNWDARTMAMQP
jgi:Flp pilus assembly protein TadD